MRSIIPMFAPSGWSSSSKIIRRTKSCSTHAMPWPWAARMPCAMELLPDPEFPRTTMRRVLADPIGMTAA
jgi:hypothetical protein